MPMSLPIPRRLFLGASALALSSSLSTGKAFADADPQSAPDSKSTDAFPAAQITFSKTGDVASFFIPGLETPSKLLHISDTHLFLDDERGKPFEQFSGRMSKAYRTPKHWRTGNQTTPMASFEESLDVAKREKVDAVALTGDILSFPSEAGRDWLLEKLKTLDEAGIPWYYVAGNHDWHYEGWPGSDAAQRAEWIPKRLGPLYPEKANFLNYSVVVKGIRHLFVDDSIYEILPEQLEFLKKDLAYGNPSVLWMHIPPYAPGRSVGFGCGHPEWGKATDKVWKIERREPWRDGGHTDVTFEFYRLVCEAPNLIGSFCGHLHIDALDVVNGKPFATTGANANGVWRLVEFLPRKF